jgi:hypothetical protein
MRSLYRTFLLHALGARGIHAAALGIVEGGVLGPCAGQPFFQFIEAVEVVAPGVKIGRRPGQRVKADRFAPKVLKLVGEGQSYREISHRLGLSKNTVLDIVKRDRAA